MARLLLVEIVHDNSHKQLQTNVDGKEHKHVHVDLHVLNSNGKINICYKVSLKLLFTAYALEFLPSNNSLTSGQPSNVSSSKSVTKAKPTLLKLKSLISEYL